MAANDDDPRCKEDQVPPARSCGNYRKGHDMHYIQARLSREDGLGEARTIEFVSNDGTITFTNGTHVWNHDPDRLRIILELFGRNVRLGPHGVLRVPSGGGEYCFSVSDAPDPCRQETGEVREGESFLDELIRRGGAMRSGRSVLDEMRERRKEMR